MWFVPILLVSIMFGAQRLAMPVVSQVHKEDLFKDFAHLLVGLLFGLGLASWSKAPRYLRKYFWLGIVLTLLELYAFEANKPPTHIAQNQPCDCLCEPCKCIDCNCILAK